MTPLRAGERLTRLRSSANAAADRYQRLAQRRPLLGLPLAFFARYTARQGLLLAGACAFRMFLWLMPLALLLAGIGAGVAGSISNVKSLNKAAGVTGAVGHEIATALHDGHKSWWVAVLVGAALFLWTTRTLMRNLTLANAHAWEAPMPKLRQRDVLATTLMFAGGWLLIFILAALTVRLDHLVPGGPVLTIAAQTLAVAAIWMVISLRLPDRRTDWIDLLPGCLLFGFGLAVLHAVSRVYLPRRFEHSSALYGTLGVAGVVLAWLLLVGQLIVASALANSIWTEYRAERRRDASATAGS